MPRPTHAPLLPLLCAVLLLGQKQTGATTVIETGTSKTVHLDERGQLVYASDRRGNRLPDFSHVGYHSGEQAIPDVPVAMTLSPAEGDDTRRIQDALDQVGKGIRGGGGPGALLLRRGIYHVAGSLTIRHSGTVLRGEGHGPEGTVIVAAGYGKAKHKRTLITVGNGNRPIIDAATKRRITDDYVPVGARRFTVRSSDGYAVGDRIALHRRATAKWISSIGCDTLRSRWETRDGKRVDATVQWTPEAYAFYFERRITAIDGNVITIDAPNVHALDTKFGGGAIYHYTTPGRVTEVGIENLRLMSEFGKPVSGHPYGSPKETGRAEQHGWNGIKLHRNSENTWVRKVTGKYFGWSLVSASGTRATVRDCASLGHASRVTGGRRYPFMIDGQLNLVQRCLTIEGRHEFVNQARTAGPNVFVDCVGYASKSSAGPHHRYAIGNLYDNVRTENIMESRFRGHSGTGHGWAGTQTCFYNCSARGFSVKAPPGGISWVIGSGRRESKDLRVAPTSLYYQQLRERVGAEAVDRLATSEQRKHLGSYRWAKERLKTDGASRD